MTKKEKIEYALDQWATGTMGLLPALRAIIDALPDEATKPDDPETFQNRQVGPKPKDECVETQPTSALSETLMREANDIMETVSVLGVDGVEYPVGCEEMSRLASLLEEASNAILGQHSDPPATSPAQPTKDYMDPVKWAAACAQSESDARKLRIIKAMEEMGDGFFSDIRNFKFTPSGWHWIDPRAEMDWQPMEQYLKTRAPEEPLWEGEIVVNDVGDAGYTLPFEPREGWRKIKVKEQR